VTDQALKVFDDGRAAFKAGDYLKAQTLTDQAISKLPNDATLHEFRALVLFALGRYDDAAATLYSVLSVGPGWNWTTLVGLYPSVDVYTAQLRQLESYRNSHPDQSSARFVLAYHYLTAGHKDAAVKEFQEVVKLQPTDKLSASLLAPLGGSPPAETQQPAAVAAAPPAVETQPAPAESNTAAAEAPSRPPLPLEKVVGKWVATPAPSTTIRLEISQDGKFTWSVTDRGRTESFGGKAMTDDGLLSLMREQDQSTLAGEVTLKETGFHFKLAGSGPGDPGLEFRKS
jgi:tetratricopeptide (TPR) repeat protein